MTESALAKAEEKAVAITPMEMLQIAVEQGADLDKLEKLMALQERWEANEARKAFVVAMARFKEEAPKLIKDREGHNSKYAGLDQICDAVGPALSKYGLSHRWRMEQEESSAIRVFCVITHNQGHSEEVFMSGMPDTSGSKNPIQAVASTVSYLERYTLLAVCGLTAREMDNDGGGNKTAITDEQADTLIALAEEVGADKIAFLKYMGVGKFSEITNYEGAVAALEKRRKK